MGDLGGDDGGAPEALTVDECIRAGMYWFGRSDLVAAEAWWQRALSMDPESVRARDCLRLLSRSTRTGFLEASSKPSSEPRAGRTLVAPQPFRAAAVVSTDPLDFASSGRSRRAVDPLPFAAPLSTPWDEGPSRTSVLTLQDDGEFYAVPEHTPLPPLDPDQFFGRGAPDARDDLADFLSMTGDLPPLPVSDPRGDAEIVIDEPVEVGHAPGPSFDDARRWESLLQTLRARYALHDFAGVLELLEGLPRELEAREEISRMAADSKKRLMHMYEAKIGDFSRKPRLMISHADVVWLNLNHRTGFLLSQVDGSVTIDDLVALSGMPRLDTLRMIAELLSDGVIA